MLDPKQQEAVRKLEIARDRLYANLEAGYDKIDKGLKEGKDVTEWEEFWVNLLSEYERVCRELQRDLAV